MNPLTLISAALQAIANFFGWSRDRSALKNAKDVRDAKERQQEADEQATEIENVAKGDIDAIRKGISE